MDSKSPNRRIFAIICGAEDDDTPPVNSGQGAGAQTGGANSGGDPADDDDDDDDDDHANLTPEQQRLKEVNAESKSRRLEIKRLQKELAAKDTQLSEYERGKNSEKENLVKDKETLTTENTTLKETNHNLVLENHILKEEKYSWNNIKLLRAALDMDAIEIDPVSGTVEGLSEELKRVAKEEPYLLKSAKRETGDGGTGGGRKVGGSTGNNPAGGGARQSDGRITDRNRLVAKYKL